MPQTVKNFTRAIAIVWSTSLLVACGWVDSTGVQGTTGGSVGASDAGLRNAQPVGILEEVAQTANLVGEGSNLTNWTWTILDSDSGNRCQSISGFDTNLSASTLDAACSAGSDCTVAIDESSGDQGTQFTLRMPKLRAPVALSYQLSTTRDDGAQVIRQQYLCGLSINEAPTANNDQFTVSRGIARVVSAEDPDNLLANDNDDDDVRNQPLQVVTTAVQAPQHASRFSLGSDGSFIYQAAEDAPLNNNGTYEDSFIYAVTDGLHTVNATAFINIVDNNSAPRQLRPVPDLTFQVSDAPLSSAIERLDLTRYFTDPDNDKLTYSAMEGSLPANKHIAVSPDGVLSVLPREGDIGQWHVFMEVSDGLRSIADDFIVTIDEAHQQPNRRPIAEDINNRIVQNTFSYDVSEFFSDPDGDALTFRARGLPANVSISADGVISGTANGRNRGTWFVLISAADGAGLATTDGFLLIIV